MPSSFRRKAVLTKPLAALVRTQYYNIILYGEVKIAIPFLQTLRNPVQASGKAGPFKTKRGKPFTFSFKSFLKFCDFTKRELLQLQFYQR